jgi:hypothetical protein
VEEYPRAGLFRLPRLFSAAAGLAASAGLAGSTSAGSAAAPGEPWTYEQRFLGLVLRNPGTPLLLTPATLLPDEPAAQ